MIVTGAFSGPRVWSADVIGGNVEVNDSGVDDTAKDVQVTGVGGTGSFVTVGMTSTVVCGVVLHAVEKISRATMVVVNTNDFIDLLLYRFLKLIKGCHPCNGVDEVFQ